MTGPADDAELCGKLLRSGAPGVMLDLEDSIVNTWEHLTAAHHNVLDGALRCERSGRVDARARPASFAGRHHLARAGQRPALRPRADRLSLRLLALAHPLCIYIPKSESAQEALWWSAVFDALIEAKGWPRGSIKAMALVESHPLAFEMEEFLFNLREYILGLNLGRWDYMASLIHYNLSDPAWLLPDRNTIPFDVAFFQRVRELLPEIAHKHGALAIGGMTALYPSRTDPQLNARALAVLERDKRNEADCLMDGAWTGHPDQNAVAVAQFPYPNQIERRPALARPRPDLRPPPGGIGATTLEGTRAAIRTVIRYRNGVLEGRGASLLDGYMEDLATDRIYRLMIAQRMRFPGAYTPPSLAGAFDDELARILRELPDAAPATVNRYRRARQISEAMIASGNFDPT